MHETEKNATGKSYTLDSYLSVRPLCKLQILVNQGCTLVKINEDLSSLTHVHYVLIEIHNYCNTSSEKVKTPCYDRNIGVFIYAGLEHAQDGRNLFRYHAYQSHIFL